MMNGGNVKAYVGKYRKTGNRYLVVMEGKTEKYFLITKVDYPYINRTGVASQKIMKKLTKEFDLYT